MKKSSLEKKPSNGHVESNGHSQDGPVAALDTALSRIERMIKNPTARPGTDAHSKLQAVMHAVEDAETLFFSQPRESFGVDFFRLRTRLDLVGSFVATVNGGRLSEAPDSSGKFSRLSDDPEIDHLEQSDMVPDDAA